MNTTTNGESGNGKTAASIKNFAEQTLPTTTNLLVYEPGLCGVHGVMSSLRTISASHQRIQDHHHPLSAKDFADFRSHQVALRSLISGCRVPFILQKAAAFQVNGQVGHRFSATDASEDSLEKGCLVAKITHRLESMKNELAFLRGFAIMSVE